MQKVHLTNVVISIGSNAGEAGIMFASFSSLITLYFSIVLLLEFVVLDLRGDSRRERCLELFAGIEAVSSFLLDGVQILVSTKVVCERFPTDLKYNSITMNFLSYPYERVKLH